MGEEVLQFALHDKLNSFRAWPYHELATAVDRTRSTHDCLAHFADTLPDGRSVQIEVNDFWDDQPGGDVRVVADLTLDTKRAFLGFIQTPDAIDSFIMQPDGSFVDES